MGGRAVSPGGALLRTSRMFSMPKPLPEPRSTQMRFGRSKSPTMTMPYPRHQTIISPLSSRQNGDWGFKRPFPLKTTLATSTPLIRIKQIDCIENVTDFASAADHSLSLEKFQELRVALSVPRNVNRGFLDTALRPEMWCKSVFEEEMDVTDTKRVRGDEKRWKFQGPWLARMIEGDFNSYLEKKVRPRRAQFRALLKARLAEDITAQRNHAALESGGQAPPETHPRDITHEQFTDYLRSLRNDRVTLYAIVSKFLDLPPLGHPVGVVQTLWPSSDSENPYGKSGPPPSHPSAGIGYLRTNSFMENHPIYGPQARRTPAVARVVYPRWGASPAKLGTGGFVADAPAGDNHFNLKYGRMRQSGNKTMLNGIMHLDLTTFGGAKAYVEPHTASVDPSGKVVLQLRETHEVAQLVARESKGLPNSSIYNNGRMQRLQPQPQPPIDPATATTGSRWRNARVADAEGFAQATAKEEDVVGSSQAYGLEPPTGRQP